MGDKSHQIFDYSSRTLGNDDPAVLATLARFHPFLRLLATTAHCLSQASNLVTTAHSLAGVYFSMGDHEVHLASEFLFIADSPICLLSTGSPNIAITLHTILVLIF